MGYKISLKLCQVVLMRQIILFQAKRGKISVLEGLKCQFQQFCLCVCSFSIQLTAMFDSVSVQRITKTGGRILLLTCFSTEVAYEA